MSQAPIDAARARKPVSYQHARPADANFVARIPADHHYDNIAEDSPLLGDQKGRRALRELYEVHEKIIETAKTVANKADLAKAVEPAIGRAVKAGRENLTALERHIAHQQTEMKKAMGSGLGPLAQEIRAHVKGLKAAERAAFVREAITAGDTDTLKAIFGVGAHYLSGLDRELYIDLSLMAEEVVAPQIVAERRAASAAWARMARALEHFEQTMTGNLKRWRGGDDAKIANLMASLQPKKEAEA